MVAFSDGSLSAYSIVVYSLWNCKSPAGREYTVVRLLIGKTRVSPIHGTTVPRAELQSLVVTSRILTTVVKAVEHKVSRVVHASDSECCLAALQKSGGVLKPFFQNRVSEYHENMKELSDMVDVVEPAQKVDTKDNPADISTRGHAVMSDVGPNSVWQNGPQFLHEPRSEWPLHRNISQQVIPKTELRTKHEVSIVSLVSSSVSGWKKLSGLVDSSMEQSNNWQKTIGILARILRATFSPQLGLADQKRLLEVPPTANDLSAARRLQFLCSMTPSVEAHKKGN